MIRSMTGYSRHKAETPFGQLIIEIKSWNARYCKVTVRTPEFLSRFDHQINSAIRNRVSRGQVQATVEWTEDASVSNQLPILDSKLAEQYHQALVKLQNRLQFGDEISLSLLVQLPGVLTAQKADLDEEAVWQVLQSHLETALDGLETTKQAEGTAMLEEIKGLLHSIQLLTRKIKAASADLVESTHTRLEARLNELLEGRVKIDPHRLTMEAGIIASRSDITEELVRLDSHCSQFDEYLQATQPIGRQLDFLLQEMNREVNTISAKASRSSISYATVALKTEIEKIRELVQNVE